MSKHYLPIKSSHPSGGSPEVAAPKCCARCRRGTPATGIGPCGLDLSCKCHTKDQQRAAWAELNRILDENGNSDTPEYRAAWDRWAAIVKGVTAPAALRETGTPDAE